MYQYVAKYLVLNRVFRFFEKAIFPSIIIGLIGFLLASYLAIYVLPADAEQKEQQPSPAYGEEEENEAEADGEEESGRWRTG